MGRAQHGSKRASTARPRRLWVILATAAAVGLAGCSGEASAPVVASSGLVTDEEPLVRMYEAPSVLYDADDPDTAYMSGVDLAAGDCGFAVSTDGGATWEEQEGPRLEPFTDCGFGSASPTNIRTQLDQAPDGTLRYVFHAQDPDAGGTRSVLLGRSSDGGDSWDTSVVHSPGEADEDEPIELNFVPHIAVDPDDPDRVVAVWRRSYQARGDDDAPPTRPWMAISDDGGETFADPFMMLDKDPGFEAPKLRIVDGRLHAFYRLRPEDGDNEVVAATSDDFGETWDESVLTTADDVSEPVVAHDPGEGRFHLVWHDNRNGDLDAFHASSTDAQEWTEPVRLNDDPVGNRVGQFYPVVSTAPDGRVDVAWYDYRDDPHAPPSSDEGPLNLFNNMGKHQTVYLTSSFNGGQTWRSNVRVTEQRIDRTYGPWDPNFFTQVPPAIASRDDGALVAWSDTRRGDSLTGSQDLAAARVAFDGAGGDTTLAMALVGGAGLLVGAGGALLIATVAMRRRAPDRTSAGGGSVPSPTPTD